jgi:hypothetical protein
VDDPTEKKLPKGIPPNHPSIGRDIREPVSGPSWPAPPDHGGGRMISPKLEFVWGMVLAIWIIFSRYSFLSEYFRDPDSAKIAFGVGQLLQGIGFEDGSFFAVAKIPGAYLLFELFAELGSVSMAGLQEFLTMICATFMIGILILNYSLAYMIWGKRVALLSTTLLSLAPMMWLSGTYITSFVPAFFFFMSGVWAMVMSYRISGGRWWVLLSSLLYAFSMFISSDMIFGVLVPICYAFFVDRRGLRRAFIIYGITGFFYLILWYIFLGRIGHPLVESFTPAHAHLPNYVKSLVANFVGISPFLFIFAFTGFLYRFVTDRRPLPFIFFWIVLINSYYTGHLYSPRYFILYYPPVAWLAAFSLIALYKFLVKLVKYNRPMRIAFMILFVLGALSMITTSFVKVDGQTKFVYGDYDLLVKRDGYTPSGSMWYYMQKYRPGEEQLFSWIENNVREIPEYFEVDNFLHVEDRILYGSDCQAFLNYHLLQIGWKLNHRSQNLFSQQNPKYGTTTAIRTSYIPDPVVEYTNRRGTFQLNAEENHDFPALTSPSDTDNIFLSPDTIGRLLASEANGDFDGFKNPATGWKFVRLGEENYIFQKVLPYESDSIFEMERWSLTRDGDSSTGWWPPTPRHYMTARDLYESTNFYFGRTPRLPSRPIENDDGSATYPVTTFYNEGTFAAMTDGVYEEINDETSVIKMMTELNMTIEPDPNIDNYYLFIKYGGQVSSGEKAVNEPLTTFTIQRNGDTLLDNEILEITDSTWENSDSAIPKSWQGLYFKMDAEEPVKLTIKCNNQIDLYSVYWFQTYNFRPYDYFD